MGHFPTTFLPGSLVFKVKLDAISLERFLGAQSPNSISSLPPGFCPLITIYLSRSSLHFKFFVGGAHGSPEYSPAAEAAQTISTDVWVEGLWRKHWDALCTRMRHRTLVLSRMVWKGNLGIHLFNCLRAPVRNVRHDEHF